MKVSKYLLLSGIIGFVTMNLHAWGLSLEAAVRFQMLFGSIKANERVPV